MTEKSIFYKVTAIGLSLLMCNPSFAASPGDGAVKKAVGDFLDPAQFGPKVNTAKNYKPTPESVCLNDELTISQMEYNVFAPLANAIAAKDFAGMQKFGFAQMLGLAKSPKATKNVEGIMQFSWKPSKTPWSAEKYIAEFGALEFVQFKVTNYSIDPAHRQPNGVFDQATLDVRFDFRGKDAANHLRQDRGTFRIGIKKADNNWKIADASTLNAETLVQNRKPAFTEMTKMAGLDKAQIYKRTEAIRRGGYALSVSDVNRDGQQDLFVGMRGNAELWQGNKGGAFTKQENHPFAKEQYTKTAVFFDAENNDKQSLMLNRYMLPKTKGHPGTDVVFFQNTGGQYTEKPVKEGDKKLREPMPAAVADFDNDGFLDFYVGYPGTQDFSYMGKADSRPLAEVQGLYLNDQKGGFKDYTEKSIAWNTQGSFEGRLFPHSSLAMDINQDGTQDLIVADDRGNLSPLFENKGNGKFQENSEGFGIVNRGYSMSIAAGDVNNDGRSEIAITNVYLTEFDRLVKSCQKHMGQDTHSYFSKLDKGFRVFQEQGKGKFAEKTDVMFPDFVGEATGGLTFFDYNNDGFQDVYVVNGLWSGTKNGQDFGSFYTSILSTQHSMRYSLRNNDKFHFMDILSNFKGYLENFSDAKTIQVGNERPSLAGYQRNRLYRNNKNGTFTEVGYLEGVDSMADGYIVSRVNFEKDGKMDLVLRNADPGTDDYQFPVVQIYKNGFQTKNKSAIFSFKGTKSNRDGFGLFAKAFMGKNMQVQHLVANSGSVQEQRILHFGMGNYAKIDKLEVHWPSGLVQTLKNVKPGYHEITEASDALKIGTPQPTAPKDAEVSSL